MICQFCGTRMDDFECPKCGRPRSLQENLPEPEAPSRILLGRCRRLCHCGFVQCVCDVDPTDPRDMAALRSEESMGELESIIDDVKNQVTKRQTGCLSMRSERLLVSEIEKLRVKAEYWRLLAERQNAAL